MVRQNVDTPTDIGIRQTELKVRQEAGNRPPPAPIKESVFAKPFTFRFRKIIGGNFAGLWELAAVDQNGRVEELIIDADALPSVLDSVGNIFANKGF